jgi:YbbR domain-containing protein
MRRAIRFVVHNWPLKLGAIALASLLYAGLVLSQTTHTLTVNVPVRTVNQAADIISLSDLGAISEVRYVAPEDLGLRVDSSSFQATVDVAGVDPKGGPVSLTVQVSAIDPRIQVLSFEPQRVIVRLDRVTSRTVPVRAVLGEIPEGLEVGDPVLDASEATVKGPESVVNRVAEVLARVAIDPSGIDFNRSVDLLPVDAAGEPLVPVDVDPVAVEVKVPVFTDRRTKTVPVNAVVTGTPAAGFEVAAISVDPVAVGVEGDANDLAALDRADTQSVSVSGASSDVTATVALALPDGVQSLGPTSVTVTVRLRPVTGSRTFEAGVVLIGARADRTYVLSTTHVLVTIGGSLADLDRLSGSTLTLTIDVTGLDVGAHELVPQANLQTGLTLVAVSPSPLTVTISLAQSSPAP